MRSLIQTFLGKIEVDLRCKAKDKILGENLWNKKGAVYYVLHQNVEANLGGPLSELTK